MTATINASTTAGVVITPDNSGAISIQVNGTGAINISSTGIVTLPNQPAFYSSTSQSSVAQGATVVWNIAELNRGTMLNTSTGIVTIPVTGIYSLQACIRYQSNGTTYVQTYIAKNGTGSLIGSSNTNSTLSNSASYTASMVQATVTLNAGDTLRVYGQSSAGTTQTFSGSESWFSGCLIG